jgi:hypothetical protein
MATLPKLPEGYEDLEPAPIDSRAGSYARPVASPTSLPPLPKGYEEVHQADKPGLWESFGRGAAEGATFGFDDKLGMDKERREASKKANPWVHFLGEVAGGIAPMTAAALLPTGASQVAAAGRGTQLLAKGAGLLRSALVPGEVASVGQAIGQGAKLGAVYGGLSGAGHTNVDPNDSYADALQKRAEGGTKGAIVGGVLGAPLGAAAHGVFRGAQNVGNLFAGAKAETAEAGKGALVTATRNLEHDRITPQQIIDNILSEFPSASDTAKGGMARRFWGNATGGNRQPITRDQVEQMVSLAAQGKTPAEISAALAPGGKGTGPGETAVKTLMSELEERYLGPMNIVDRVSMVRPGAGDNTQMSMRAAAATPGEHVGIAREALLDRQLGANTRFQNLLERTLGSPDLEAVRKKAMDDLQSAGSRAYVDAFASEKPFNLEPIFNKWDAQFDRMRGLVPDTVRARLKAMMWEETDAAGQVVRTPPQNLQSFMYAREGLRDMINDLPQGNNLRRNLSRMYDEMTDEVARTNPAWKAANDIWRDGMAAQEALDAGSRMSTRLNDATREHLSVFTKAQKEGEAAEEALKAAYRAVAGPKTRKAPTDQQLAAATPDQRAAIEQAQARLDAANAKQRLFKDGMMRPLVDALMNQGETHDLSRRFLTPGAQKILRTVLGDDAEQVINVIRAEAAMKRTHQSQFGSQTTPLAEKIKEQTWAPRFEASITNPMTWPNLGIQLAHEAAARTINARRNTDLMKLYTETDPLKQLEILRAMQALHQVRSNFGNVAGKSTLGAETSGVGAKLGDKRSDETSPIMPAYKP